MIHVEILARDLEAVRKALGLPKRFLTPHLVCIGLNATAAEASKTGKNRYLVAILPPRTAFRALPCDHPDLATKPMIVMVEVTPDGECFRRQHRLLAPGSVSQKG